MKNIAIYLSFALLFSGCLFRKCNPASNTTFGQPLKTIPLSSFKNDTLAYLKENFLVSKNKFIGKSAKLVFGAIETPITNYYSLETFRPKFEIKGVSLYFETGGAILSKQNERIIPNILNIKLVQPINVDSVELLRKKYLSKWTKEVAGYEAQIFSFILKFK